MGRFDRVPAWLLVVGALFTLCVVAVVVLGLMSGSSGNGEQDVGKDAGSPPRVDANRIHGEHIPIPTAGDEAGAEPGDQHEGEDDRESSLPRMPETRSPEEYAAAVAEVVLGLSPRDHTREEYLDLLLAELVPADVAGEDYVPGLEASVAGWLPEPFQWQRQRDYEQSATFTVETVWTPQDEQADLDAWGDGALFVRTVAGVQKLEFLDEQDKPSTTSSPRTVSLVVHCPPVEWCSLLGISPEVVQ